MLLLITVAAAVETLPGESDNRGQIIVVPGNGQLSAQIAINQDALPVEKHAAAELQKYIRQMSDAELPVAYDASSDHPNIYIGQAAPPRGVDLSEWTIGFDGYVVKSINDDIILIGLKPYSCLYAVYHLLERYLGCGFFEHGDQIPRRTSITASCLNDVCKPKFEWRNKCVSHFVSYSGHRWFGEEQWKRSFDWLVKTRLNACEVSNRGKHNVAIYKFSYDKKRGSYDTIQIQTKHSPPSG